MDCLNCSFKSEPFQQLTNEQLLKVNEHRAELSFKPGELMSKQGMLMSHIIYIKKGFAKLYQENDGELTILSIAEPGRFIGVQALFGKSVMPFSVEAITDAEVCMKDIHVFRELVLENPEFTKGIIELLNAELCRSYKRLIYLTKSQMHSRFSELLLYMQTTLYGSNPFTLTISRKDMADLISTTPESISRLIHEYKQLGLIKSKGHIMEILDADKLINMWKPNVHEKELHRHAS